MEVIRVGKNSKEQNARKRERGAGRSLTPGRHFNEELINSRDGLGETTLGGGDFSLDNGGRVFPHAGADGPHTEEW